MSPVSVFAAVLMLAVATRPAASQMGGNCVDGIQQCTGALVGSLQTGAMPEGGPCGLLQNFVSCIMGMGCQIPKEQMDKVISDASAPLAAQGINCDIKADGSATGSGPASGSASGTEPGMSGMGGMGGGDMGMAGMNKACGDAMTKCTKEYTDGVTQNMGQVCGVLKTYNECIDAAPCPMDADTKAQMVGKMYTQMEQQGIKCDTDTGTMTITETGEGGASAMGIFFQLQAKFSEHKCEKVPMDCSKEHGGSSTDKPSCDEVKKVAQCMFSKCTAIQGTTEATESADLLVKLGKQSQCSFTASELQSNGSPVILAGSFLVLMLSVLVTMIFV